jgi:predicted lipoprotein
VILPLYEEFEHHALGLDDRVRELCLDPDDERLDLARTAWWDARAPLKQAEVFAFGPYQDQPFRLGPKIDFWPARADTIDEVLAGAEPLDEETVSRFGAPARGLPAIEYLLHPPGGDFLGELTLSPRRCDYLTALARDLAVNASALRLAWDPDGHDYLGELREAGRTSNSFATLDMAVGEVVNRLGFTLENMRSDKLGKPLGSGGVPAPDAAESRFSGRSLEDLRDNLEGIRLVYSGTADAGGVGLGSYLESRGHEFDTLFDARLAEARRAIDAIEPPLTEAVSEDPRSVERAIGALAELGRLIQVDLINALALTGGFNDNDGD